MKQMNINDIYAQQVKHHHHHHLPMPNSAGNSFTSGATSISPMAAVITFDNSSSDSECPPGNQSSYLDKSYKMKSVGKQITGMMKANAPHSQQNINLTPKGTIQTVKTLGLKRRGNRSKSKSGHASSQQVLLTGTYRKHQGGQVNTPSESIFAEDSGLLTIASAEGSIVVQEEAVIKDDEMMAHKRRKLDGVGSFEVNTQTSVKTSDTDQAHQNSIQSPMRQEILPIKQNVDEKPSPIGGIISANILKQLQKVKAGGLTGQQKIQSPRNLVKTQPLASLSEQTRQLIQGLSSVGNKQQLETGSIKLQPKAMSIDDLLKEENSMRFKHSELLAVKRELILPSHYKKLLDIMKFMDNSLNFLKSCRKQNACNFEEIKRSIEKSNGRQFDMTVFRQILSVMPKAYSHKWEAQGTESQQLIIDFPQSENMLSQQAMEERLSSLKQCLINLTKKHHDEFLKTIPRSDDIMETIDPVQHQMWHHKFDVHSVPAIAQAEIQTQSKSISHQRSESVKDFLNRSKLSNISVNETAKQQPKIQAGSNSPKQIDQKLLEMQKKTGLSIETLKLIQAKSDQVKQAKEQLNKTIAEEDSSKQQQQLVRLAEQIRQTFLMKQKQTISLKDILNSLNDSMRGTFRSQAELQGLISQIATLVPEWLQLKEIGTAGKFVKCSSTITGNQVQDWIKERCKQ